MKSESALRKILHGVSSTAGTLESIGRPINSSEDLFVFSIVELLDGRSRREWENGISDSPNPPTFVLLKRFLEHRLQTLEAIQPVKSESVANKSSESSSRAARTHHVQKREPGWCTLCKKDHALMVCDDYKSKMAHRRQLVDGNHFCANCLGKHKIADCPSKRLCSVCSEKHHTLLHDAFRKVPTEESAEKTSLVAHSSSQRISTVLLATARIRIVDRFRNIQEVRALIDQGSEATIITEKLAQRLRLPRRHTSIAVFGVGGQQTGVAKGSVSVSVWPRSGKNSVSASALILPRLTVYATSSDASPTEWSHIRGLDLADSNLASLDPIDVLLGTSTPASCSAISEVVLARPLGDASGSEKRFLREDNFRDLYKEFMTTYESMNHMSRAVAGNRTTRRICYLPHHGVLKKSSASTRLRVVFNGSWAVFSGTSLNEHLQVKKNLLPALTDVLLRWRWHRYVLADVEKMYRQIVVHEDDRDLQRIFWRSDINAEMSGFRLNTVTYGLACAPFLAVRTLQQLARDEAENF
ncbi:bel12-ag transposon polyprotein [Lasius niger]|uniref:Bel12-ag transposon polyprotein n=1 Tax=Lasius niger TaxID=67767 RepID=A0A0J7N010_LASNI|nr:bel12-ag transposon polyprotein [Lasius niger]